MIEGIGSYQNLPGAFQPQAGGGLEEAVQSSGLLQRAATARTADDKRQIKQEFLALFYKEILKQAIKPPNFSGQENDHSISSSLTADILLQKMALELAQSETLGENVIDE